MNVTSNSNSDSSHESNGNGGPLSWIGRQTAFLQSRLHSLTGGLDLSGSRSMHQCPCNVSEWSSSEDPDSRWLKALSLYQMLWAGLCPAQLSSESHEEP